MHTSRRDKVCYFGYLTIVWLLGIAGFAIMVHELLTRNWTQTILNYTDVSD